jgi:hypothetical protein
VYQFKVKCLHLVCVIKYIDSYCLLKKRNNVKQLWMEKDGLNIFEARRVKSDSEYVAPKHVLLFTRRQDATPRKTWLWKNVTCHPSSNSNVLPCRVTFRMVQLVYRLISASVRRSFHAVCHRYELSHTGFRRKENWYSGR